MLRPELFETTEPGSVEVEAARLPYHIAPLPEEALISWVCRLAARFDWRLRRLIESGFGITGSLQRDWWTRPPDGLMNFMALHAGVTRAQIRDMTLHGWADPVRHDEAMGRFNSNRYQVLRPAQPERGLAVCPRCLVSDAVPYLRRSWLIGWVAICEVHQSILLSFCPNCRRSFRSPNVNSTVAFRVARCIGCGFAMTEAACHDAPEREAQFQRMALSGKRSGVVHLAGIGTLGWSDFINLCDVLLGAIWKGIPLEPVGSFIDLIDAEVPSIGERDGIGFGRSRFRSLALLSWLLADWPQHVVSTPLLVAACRAVGERPDREVRIGPSREELRRSRVPEIITAAMAGE